MPNAWDAGSAVLIAQAGAKAIATSGGIAWSAGRPDGQGLTRAEMIEQVRRIAAAVDIPVTADVEGGYSPGPEDVGRTVEAVIATGAIGVNIEDSQAPGGPLFDASPCTSTGRDGPNTVRSPSRSNVAQDARGSRLPRAASPSAGSAVAPPLPTSAGSALRAHPVPAAGTVTASASGVAHSACTVPGSHTKRAGRPWQIVHVTSFPERLGSSRAGEEDARREGLGGGPVGRSAVTVASSSLGKVTMRAGPVLRDGYGPANRRMIASRGLAGSHRTSALWTFASLPTR